MKVAALPKEGDFNRCCYGLTLKQFYPLIWTLIQRLTLSVGSLHCPSPPPHELFLTCYVLTARLCVGISSNPYHILHLSPPVSNSGFLMSFSPGKPRPISNGKRTAIVNVLLHVRVLNGPQTGTRMSVDWKKVANCIVIREKCTQNN